MPGLSVMCDEASLLVGEVGGGPAASAAEGLSVRPPPNPPHKGEGLRRLTVAPDAIQKARHLRRQMTQAEVILWRQLREAFPECHWRKQVPLGPYFADFASHRPKLIIELDGGQHAAAIDHDARRTAFFNEQGYHVLRFWNDEVQENVAGVLNRIGEHLSCH